MVEIKDISCCTWSLRIRESRASESSEPVHLFSLLSLKTLGINDEVMKETLNRLFPPSPDLLSQILSASVSHSNLILDFFFFFFFLHLQAFPFSYIILNKYFIAKEDFYLLCNSHFWGQLPISFLLIVPSVKPEAVLMQAKEEHA